MQFRYAQIERAVAAANGLPDDPDVMKTFRGRVRNFQKIGLVPSAPGRGQKVSYEYEDALVWALCFELSALGLSPSAIKWVVEEARPQFLSFFFTRTQYKNGQDVTVDRDVYLIIEMNHLNWNLQQTKKNAVKIWFADEAIRSGLLKRALIINMSAMKNDMRSAFASSGLPIIQETILTFDK